MPLTPMMQKYMETKEEYKDCILFYRLGDFYEMFFEDAKTCSQELDLTLTGKSCGLEERAPMCGVPFHSADIYIDKLVGKGYKVAICEQVEDPKLAKGLVKREVIRVATKYPKIAKDYFYNKKHQTVELIKMNGSIELAPIVGLSEVIVDIVETGTTLNENGLVVLEEVCPLSARMIVNPVSMRMENDRIKKIVTDLRELLREEQCGHAN